MDNIFGNYQKEERTEKSSPRDIFIENKKPELENQIKLYKTLRDSELTPLNAAEKLARDAKLDFFSGDYWPMYFVTGISWVALVYDLVHNKSLRIEDGIMFGIGAIPVTAPFIKLYTKKRNARSWARHYKEKYEKNFEKYNPILENLEKELESLDDYNGR